MEGPSAADLNRTTSTIIKAAIRIHRTLGPGLLESAYLGCLGYELTQAGLPFEAQKSIPLLYHGVHIDCAYRADFVVNRAVLVELKAVEALAPIHSRQLQTYLRLADCRIGLLLNFGAPIMREGIRRIVNGFPEEPEPSAEGDFSVRQPAGGAEAAEVYSAEIAGDVGREFLNKGFPDHRCR